MKRSERGISLVALVIVIIVFLILAGVSISFIVSNKTTAPEVSDETTNEETHVSLVI